jgi:hypothetical protein
MKQMFIRLTTDEEEKERWSNVNHIESVEKHYRDNTARIRFVSGDYMYTNMAYTAVVAEVRKLTEIK